MRRVLVTGSGGLIGSESAKFYLDLGYEVLGIDNNLRKYFFGEIADTTHNISELAQRYKSFRNYSFDLRERQKVLDFFRDKKGFDLVIHTAAQPSHDWAAKEPFTDFDVNANGTLNLLEAFRQYSPAGVFIFTSTNKVYGDNPNKVGLVEKETRFDYAAEQTMQGVSGKGISEQMSMDQCTHSLFGVSKASADFLCQEYGRYFGLNVGVFRGGCLTGPQHSAVQLHGFLAYIVDRAVKDQPYTIIGYKGKQVRDQIHSFDVVSAFHEFYKEPRKGEAYNIGGGRENSASILEIANFLRDDFGITLNSSYVDENRIGDHICYYTDLTKLRSDYPKWKITRGLKAIISEIIETKKAK